MIKYIFIFLIPFYFIACGYHFSLIEARRAKAISEVSLGVEKIYIQLFQNHTPKRGLENNFLNALVYEFNTGKGLQIVKKTEAEAFLLGELTGYRAIGIAYTKGEHTATGRISLTVKAILKDREGKILWQKTISDQEEYQVTNNPSETKGNREIALQRILDRLAERIYEGLIMGI